MIEWFLTIVKAILQVFGTIYLVCMFMWILYWIGTFFDWCEHKRYEKDMNEYLKHKEQIDEIIVADNTEN